MRDFRHLGAVDYLRIWWRRKWYFIVTFVLVGVSAGVYAVKLPLVYKSEARIIVDAPPISEEVLRQTSDRAGSEERATAIRQQVQSRTFLEELVRDNGQLFQVSAPGSMDVLINTLRRSTVVSSIGGSVISITFASTDPYSAQNAAKAVSDKLVYDNQNVRQKRAENANLFLVEQLASAQKDLEQTEAAIKDFKVKHYGQLPDQEAANLNILNSLQAQLAGADLALERARDQKNLLEVRAREQKRLGMLTRNLFNTQTAPTKTESAPSQPNPLAEQLALKRSQLSEMAAKYTPKHPDVVRLAREVEDLELQVRARAAQKSGPSEMTPLSPPVAPKPEPARPEMASNPGEMTDVELRVETEAANVEITKRQREREEIQKQIGSYQSRLQIAPQLEEEYRRLALEQESAQARYRGLQEKKFQASMASDLEKNRNNVSYRILDPANLPIEAAFPNRTHISLMGILGALLLGLGASFGREYIDPTIGGEQEAVRVLALPVLVSIPAVPEMKSKRRLLGGKDAA
jgi:polysaccharide biosynthesis transport protein